MNFIALMTLFYLDQPIQMIERPAFSVKNCMEQQVKMQENLTDEYKITVQCIANFDVNAK